jgi:hypothetical protein
VNLTGKVRTKASADAQGILLGVAVKSLWDQCSLDLKSALWNSYADSVCESVSKA